MPLQADILYKSREDILAAMVTAWLARVPDANTGADSNARLLFEVMSGEDEGLYLAVQLLREDMFIQTMSEVALARTGEQYGLPMDVGVEAGATVTFIGAGGVTIPAASSVGAVVSGSDVLRFNTDVDATIPNPGIPTAPTAADGGAGGTNLTGTFEWGVTFVTTGGETALGALSNPLTLAAHQANLTAIPLGGPGTTSRKIYRRKNGGALQYVATIANNSTTTYTDNIADGSLGGAPPAASTAESVAVSVTADEPGEAYNVGAGTITLLQDVPSGIVSVTNGAPATAGADAQDTESFRADLLEWVRNPKTGSPGDLRAWAKQVPGVEDATVFSNDNMGTPTNGHATVRIYGAGGTTPSAGLIAATLAYLQSKDVANVTLHVGGFTANTINVAATMTMEAGYSLGDVSDEVARVISSYVNSRPVGATVYITGLEAAGFGVLGVADINVTAPASDATSTATQKPVIGTVTLT